MPQRLPAWVAHWSLPLGVGRAAAIVRAQHNPEDRDRRRISVDIPRPQKKSDHLKVFRHTGAAPVPGEVSSSLSLAWSFRRCLHLYRTNSSSVAGGSSVPGGSSDPAGSSGASGMWSVLLTSLACKQTDDSGVMELRRAQVRMGSMDRKDGM